MRVWRASLAYHVVVRPCAYDNVAHICNGKNYSVKADEVRSAAADEPG
jgi:hypothetical protein